MVTMTVTIAYDRHAVNAHNILPKRVLKLSNRRSVFEDKIWQRKTISKQRENYVQILDLSSGQPCFIFLMCSLKQM